MTLTDTWLRRTIWIVILISIPIAVMYLLKPKADYLPDGNQNLAFAFILPPPGANIHTIE